MATTAPQPKPATSDQIGTTANDLEELRLARIREVRLALEAIEALSASSTFTKGKPVPPKKQNWFASIPAKRWEQVGVGVLVVYLVIGIVLANFPSMFEPIKQTWFIWGPPGILVGAMALWRVLIETIESA